jgi:nucleoside-diphosphate-sugar epimerase
VGTSTLQAMNVISGKPRIILFGSHGFLGSYLYSNLVLQGYLVVRADFNLAKFESFLSKSKLEKKETIVISMAWSSNSKKNYLNDPENLVWAKKHIEIAKYCLRNNCIFIVPGSCLEYGENQVVEYVKAKLQLRKFLDANMPVNKYLWLRYFYVFSLAHRRPGLIRDALEAKSMSKPFTISNPRGHHDYIEVRDAVAQTVELIKGFNTGEWDIGAGRTRSNLDILSRITNLSIVEGSEVVVSSKTRVSWEGAAKKLIPNHTKFTTHTNQFFGTLLS